MELHILSVKPPSLHFIPTPLHRHVTAVAVNCRRLPQNSGEPRHPRRRDVLITPFLAAGAFAFRYSVARADEKPASEGEPAALDQAPVKELNSAPPEKEEMLNSRIYDATVIGEPMALGKDRKKVWEKIMDARIVYLGEAEQVPVSDDRELELEIMKTLRKRCNEAGRFLSLALEAFPCNLQEQLDQYMDNRFGFYSLTNRLFMNDLPR